MPDSQYKNISEQARKQYDNVVGLATKLKGKWDNGCYRYRIRCRTS